MSDCVEEGVGGRTIFFWGGGVASWKVTTFVFFILFVLVGDK